MPQNAKFILERKKIRLGRRYIEAFSIKLSAKNFVLLKGSKGYIMCGYLDLNAAEEFKDVAVKIAGVSTIGQALQTTVHSCTSLAEVLGIFRGQSVKEALKIIA